MDETVLAAHEVHECTKVHDIDDFTIVDFADFGFLNNAFNPLLRRFDLRTVRRRNLDCAFVINVDLSTGFRNDFTDNLTASADNIADLRFVDLHGFDTRCVLADFGTGVAQRLGHFTQDVIAAAFGLLHGGFHDFLGNTGDLNVHLKRGDTARRTGHFEVHIAKVIFITQNVGQNGEFIAFQDQAHRNTRNRVFDRNAGIHHRQTAAANRRHG